MQWVLLLSDSSKASVSEAQMGNLGLSSGCDHAAQFTSTHPLGLTGISRNNSVESCMNSCLASTDQENTASVVRKETKIKMN